MKRFIYTLIFLILVPAINFGQTWDISQQLKCDNDLKILDIKKDVNDNYYATGTFKGTFENNTSEGLNDIFLICFDKNFNVGWVQTIGSSSVELDSRIALDAENNIFLMGAFKDSCVFDNGKYLKSEGNFDVFLAKYSSAGNLNWTKTLANYPSLQKPTDIDIDIDNNLIITGYYTDSIFIYDEKIVSSGTNNFYAKIDTSGAKIWVKNVTGSSAFSRFANVKVYQDEYYFNGYFRDDLNLDLGTITSNVATKQDLFLYKTDINGNGLWVRRTYGDNLDATGSITGDEYGNIYFTGYFQSSTLLADSTESIVSNRILNHINDFDIFILKYNKSGTLRWNRQFGKNGRDYGVDLNVNNNILYMSGYYSDTIVFGTDTLTTTGTGDQDMFLTSLDLNANPYNSITLGGTDGNENAAGAIVLNSGNVVMSGYFQSSSLNVGDSVYVNTTPGLRDGVIAKYSAPLSAVFSEVKDITCNSDSDGELIVTPEFGILPYTYTWSHNGSLADSTATGLATGTYTVTVKDALDSTAVVSYDLTEPDIINFNAVITNVTSCSYGIEGAINVNVAGGNSGYAYNWVESNGGYGSVLKAEDQSSLRAGTYAVTVTDSKSCTADTTINITAPSPVTFGGSVVTDSSSSGVGDIDLQFTGGTGLPASFTFDWEGPNGGTAHTEDTTNLSPGEYKVTVTDINACAFDTNFQVLNLDTFYIYIADYKDACNGSIDGNATVSFRSPDSHTNITYLWDGNAGSQTTATAINLASGRYYSVTVTDTDNTPNIVMVDSVYISALPYTFDGEISVLSTSSLNCFGDSDGFIDLTITSVGELPYSYIWTTSGTTQDLTGLSTGTYGVTATDDNGCSFSVINYSITQPTVLAGSAEIVQSPSCNGDFDGEVTVDRSGGTSPYTYQWDDPGFQSTRNADGLDAGYYNVTVSDVNNCTVVSGVDLTEPALINITQLVNNEICNSAGEGSVTLTVTGGTSPFTYFWSSTNGSGLTVTDKNQTGLTAGNYYFTATDDNNCTFEDSTEITEPPIISITNEEKTDVSTCYGENTGTITIAASGGTGLLSYTLNPGAVQTNNTGAFTGIGAGSYTVDVEDANGCGPFATSSLVIAEPALIRITGTEVNNALCNGQTDGNIDITVTGGIYAVDYAYSWTTTNGSGLVSDSEDQPALGAGDYNLTVTDDNSCEQTSSFSLTEPGVIIISMTVNDILCNNGTGVVIPNVTGGVLPFSFLWTTPNGSGLEPTNKNQGGLGPGTYYLFATDGSSCIAEDTVVLTNPVVISIDSESSTDANGLTVADGTITVAASGGTGALTYTLSPGASSNSTGVFSSLLPGDYTVSVVDANLCGPVNSNTITIGSTNAVFETGLSDKFKLYPNPTSSIITLELDNNHNDKLNLEILGISGQLIFKKQLTGIKQKIKEDINLTGLPKGIYVVRVSDSNNTYLGRIVLE